MKKITLILGITVLALTARGNSIVFNTLSSTNTYNQSTGFAPVVSHPQNTFKPVMEIANQFTAAASGNLATVDLGLTVNGFQGSVNVFLYADAGGMPDNAHQTFLGSGTPSAAYGSTNNSLVSFAVAGTVPVTIGTTYWLVVKPAGGNMFDAWNFSSGALGKQAGSFNDSTWTAAQAPLEAFRLTAASAVTAVADSGNTILLLLGSVAALFGLRRMVQGQRAKR